MAVIRDKSKIAVLRMLQAGGKYSPQDIGQACGLQHNTVVKNIKFLRDDGYAIEKERIAIEGDRHFYRYFLTESPGALGNVVESVDDFAARSLAIAKLYPDYHIQKVRIVQHVISHLKRQAA